MKKLIATSVLAGFVAAIVLAPALSATAALPPTSRPVKPSATAKWGMNTSLMTSAVTEAESDPAGFGGWSKRSITTMGDPTTNRPTFTAQCYLSEPGHLSSNIGFGIRCFTLGDARDPGVRSAAVMRFGAGYTVATGGFGFAGRITCATSEWSTSQTVYTHNWGGGVSITAPSGPTYTDTAVTVQAQDTQTQRVNCPYLVSVEAFLMNFDSRVYPSAKKIYPITWSAESWFSKKAYLDGDYESAICKGGGQTATGCKDYGDVDPADYCLGAPVLEWGNWDWLPATIVHYSDCLWNPYGGWDSGGWLGDALADSPLEVFSAGLAGLTNGWSSVTGGCGLITVGSGNWAAFRINTCDWGEFAPPMKIVLTLVIGVMSAIWVISFIISSTTGIFNKYTPNPLTHDPEPRGVHFE